MFEAKEKAIQEMGVLMGQAEKEQAGFEEEWRQLTQIIEDDKRERVRECIYNIHQDYLRHIKSRMEIIQLST